MSFKKTIVFLVLLIIIVIAAYIIKAPKNKKKEIEALFPSFDPVAAESIVIDNKSSKINLKKN